MNLWIIYKGELGASRILAEILQNRLEEYLDVSVGNASKISPAMILEEKVDFLIIGDTTSEDAPSEEMQNWLIKYREISEKNKVTTKAVSGFTITPLDITIGASWKKFVKESVKSEQYNPPVMQFAINRSNLTLEKGAIEKVKKFSKDFIMILIEANV